MTVRHTGVPVASVLSLYHSGAVMPYWGGGTWDARRLRANDRMYFELMLHARERGCETFDFGRSKTGSGAYHFKKNWGFVPEPLSYGRSLDCTGARATRCRSQQRAASGEHRAVEKAAPGTHQADRPADRAGAGMSGGILFLAHRLPFPPDRGDKIRSHHILKALRWRRYTLAVLPKGRLTLRMNRN